MTFNFVEDKKRFNKKIKDKEAEAQKTLKNVLSSYMKQKNLDEKSIQKMKKEFLEIKNNMKMAKSSYETLMEIQKKLSCVYNKLNEKAK